MRSAGELAASLPFAIAYSRLRLRTQPYRQANQSISRHVKCIICFACQLESQTYLVQFKTRLAPVKSLRAQFMHRQQHTSTQLSRTIFNGNHSIFRDITSYIVIRDYEKQITNLLLRIYTQNKCQKIHRWVSGKFLVHTELTRVV